MSTPLLLLDAAIAGAACAAVLQLPIDAAIAGAAGAAVAEHAEIFGTRLQGL
jgi:hypothetical protein